MGKPLTAVYLVALLVITVSAAAVEEGNDSGCSAAAAVNSATDLKYKIVAIFSTLIVGVFGVCLPIFDVLDLDGFFYACVRQIGTYVMLLAALLYVLPDATDSLTSSCIIGDLQVTGVNVARAAAILVMIESKSFASAFMNRSHSENHNGDGHVRQKLVTQFFELGIVFHSLVIGIALGASPNLITIKPLVAAITFHQLLEGIGRGGCISNGPFLLGTTETRRYEHLSKPLWGQRRSEHPGLDSWLGRKSSWQENF